LLESDEERRAVVITIGNYVKPKTLEEAYELNQARSSRVMGGMMWMRLGNARVKTIIDLSDLGLDQIEDEGNVIKIGAMCTLRQIEQCEALKELYGDGIAESVRHIVGVQFRNQATIGGSIYGRFGFSDVLTAFLALDTFVELYDGGTIRLSEFVNRRPDKDILLSIIVRKSKRKFRYESIRQTKTDFPVIACSVVTGMVHGQETWYFSVGARPMKAALLEKQWEIPSDASEEMIAEYAKQAASEFTYGSNMRGSAEYRQHLAEVLIRREMASILAEGR
jgi:CO/xanthine dehydrogenase FAD-binding subunit